MQIIGKNHEIVQFIKEIEKTNHYPNYIVTDDLEVLHLSIKYHLNILCLLYSYEENFKSETKMLLEHLIQSSKETYEVSDHTLASFKTKDYHAGILAVLEIPKYNFDDLKDFILVLDHLELPGNIGTIYRTLDACGATGVILVDPISKPNQPKILTSSRGTNLIIPTVVSSYQQALDYLINHHYTIYLGEPELGHDYQSYDYQGKIAIVVGNERFGIQKDWYEHPHQKVYIPMVGNNNSINVGVAASILAYEAAMKRKNFEKNK